MNRCDIVPRAQGGWRVELWRGQSHRGDETRLGRTLLGAWIAARLMLRALNRLSRRVYWVHDSRT